MTDDLVKQLRDEALSLHGSAWRDQSGGQETTMSAVLADQAADRIEALTAHYKVLWEANLRIGIERDALTADNARLREVVLEADKLLCGDLAGLQWKRECRSFLVLARAVLKGETRD